MKLLSIAIPCYNSEAYMEHCINTLLTGGDEVEIIIVDDGSQKDRTPEIADEYERRYPGICRAIHQENGGHGQAVNTGLKNATGVFFKVVDSDDWVNEEAYQKVLETLRKFVYGQETIDMLVTNFVYEKEGAKRKKVMNYHTAFPKDKVFTWKDVKFFMTGQYILMHSVIYRVEMLRNCGLELPKHTFYVDNIFVYLLYLTGPVMVVLVCALMMAALYGYARRGQWQAVACLVTMLAYGYMESQVTHLTSDPAVLLLCGAVYALPAARWMFEED